MNPRLLTSAVAIHATACAVAIFAVGHGQADASYDYFREDHLKAIPEIERPRDVESSRLRQIQKIADKDIQVSAPVWDEAKFDAQLEVVPSTGAATDDETLASERTTGGEVVIVDSRADSDTSSGLIH